MATITAAKRASNFHTLFNDVEEVFFSATVAEKEAELNALSFIELPVVEDGVNLNTGEADVTQIKLTTGSIWASKVKRGDADISMNVPSVSKEILDMFLNKTKDTTDFTIESFLSGAYTGGGYSLAPKRVNGALALVSNDRETLIIFPKVEVYASFVAADGDTPAYFALKVTPLVNSEGSEIYIKAKKVGG